MGPTIRVSDGDTGAGGEHQLAVRLPAERVTVRQLIESRVYQEVTEFNASGAGSYRGLVRPRGGRRDERPIDWRAQCDVAVRAFERGQLLVIVDEHQVEELERELDVDSRTSVSFLRLVPLVGG